MRTARRISQIVFLVLFLWLFIRAAFPYETTIPSDLFLRSSPLVALSTMIASRQFISSVVLALIILALTVPLGRLFCGWICPLGTIIDGSDNLIRRIKRKVGRRESTNYRWIKFGLLSAVLAASVFSVQLIWFFDPLVLLTRTVTATLFPMFTFFFEELFSLGFALKPAENFFYSLYSAAQSSFLPIESRFFQQAIVILLLFSGILVFGLATRRFWCRNLCPLGALLGVCSKFRLLKREVSDACTECGICQIKCKMNAIEDDYTVNSTIECIECAECVAVCPVSAVRYRIGFHKKPAKVDLSRRRFIQSGIVGAVAVGAMSTEFVNRINRGKAIRPPGALEEEAFLDRCVRCQECVRICSTTGGCLQPSFLESGLRGMWSPISVPREGYCEYNCQLCGEVCPTGAIHALPLEEKQKLRMGLAYFDKSRCIPWYKNIDCLVCEEHCPLPDKAIKFDEREVRRIDGVTAVIKFPYVDEELCIGCGICVTKCPVIGTPGIFVTNAEEQRWSDDKE